MVFQEIDHPAFRIECNDIGTYTNIIIECKANNKQLVLEATEDGLVINQNNKENNLIYSDPIHNEIQEEAIAEYEEDECEELIEVETNLENAQSQIDQLKNQNQKLQEFLEVIIFNLPLFKLNTKSSID